MQSQCINESLAQHQKQYEYNIFYGRIVVKQLKPKKPKNKKLSTTLLLVKLTGINCPRTLSMRC